MRAEPDVERALQTPMREQVQQEADKATYERRAMAVERERAIAENELQNQIELARREEQLVAQRGQNDRREPSRVAAGRMDAEGKAAQQAAAGRSPSRRHPGGGRGKGRVGGRPAGRLPRLAPATLIGLAAKELAGNLPRIGTLKLTPDVLAPILAGWARAWGGPGPGGGAMTLAPRVVLVHRRTELDELVARHGTHGRPVSSWPAGIGTWTRSRPGTAPRPPRPGWPRPYRRLAAQRGRAGRPEPLRVRPRGCRRGGRPGRAGRQRRQVPPWATGHRDQPGTGAQPGGPGPDPPEAAAALLAAAGRAGLARSPGTMVRR